VQVDHVFNGDMNRIHGVDHDLDEIGSSAALPVASPVWRS
jgi:hypothetical protein